MLTEVVEARVDVLAMGGGCEDVVVVVNGGRRSYEESGLLSSTRSSSDGEEYVGLRSCCMIGRPVVVYVLEAVMVGAVVKVVVHMKRQNRNFVKAVQIVIASRIAMRCVDDEQ